MNSEMMEALENIEREKGISIEIMLEALANALVTAYKRMPDAAEEALVEIDIETGDIRVIAQELDENPALEMNERMGLTTHAAWLQQNPDGSQLAVVVLDGPGASEFLGKLATSDHEFDTWFRTGIEYIHPMDLSAPPPPAPVRFL